MLPIPLSRNRWYGGISCISARQEQNMPIHRSVLVSLLLCCACAAIARPGRWSDETAIADYRENKSVLFAQAGTPEAGVGLTTAWPGLILHQGDTISHTLEVSRAISGQRIRIQNSNHGAII
jgi:hypothetical protein